jgi:hypothetical protein
MNKLRLILLLAALAFGLAACTEVVFENPLVNPNDFGLDKRLVGEWYGSLNPDCDRWHHFYYVRAVSLGDLQMIVDVVRSDYVPDPGNEAKEVPRPVIWYRYKILRTQIAGVQYLNARPISRMVFGEKEMEVEKSQTYYYILKYEIHDDGSLSISDLHSDYRCAGSAKIEEDIKSGKLAGRKLGALAEVIRITETSDKLREYIEQNSDQLFTKHLGTLRKIAPKVPQAAEDKK